MLKSDLLIVWVFVLYFHRAKGPGTSLARWMGFPYWLRPLLVSAIY